MAVKLNSKAYKQAVSLIKQGKYVVSNSWKAPSAKEENAYIEENGFDKFALWYLGEDTEADKETKQHYKFPYSNDFENVDRKGIIAIKQRSAQQGYADIEEAAGKLLDLIDSKEEGKQKNADFLLAGVAEENKDILILITGKFYGSIYGEFEVTEETLQQAIKNFNKSGEIPIDINHAIDYPEPEKAKARGWIKKLYTQKITKEIMSEYEIKDSRVEGEIGLFGKVEWLEETKDLIRKGEFKFLSPEFTLDAMDKLTGKKIGAKIYAVSLTNIPFLKGLIGKVKLNELDKKTLYFKGGAKMKELLKLFEVETEEELREKAKKVLAEKMELEESVKTLSGELEKLKESVNKKTELEERVRELETDLEITKLLNEGKILAGDVEYVKKLMKAGKDLVEEFVKRREVDVKKFSGTGENKIAGNTKEEIRKLANEYAEKKGLKELNDWEALKLYFRDHPGMEDKYFSLTE